MCCRQPGNNAITGEKSPDLRSERNPVKRGLVAKPENWKWSSFRHYLTGVEGVVEIESQWTARKRERMGIALKVKRSS